MDRFSSKGPPRRMGRGPNWSETKRQWLVVSGGIATFHHNPAKPGTWLAIAYLAAILLILPILSIHVESSSPMDEQDRQDQWSGWVQPLTPSEECLFRRPAVPPPSRLGAGGRRQTMG